MCCKDLPDCLKRKLLYVTMHKEMKSTCQVRCNAGLALNSKTTIANDIKVVHWDQLIIQC